MLDDDFDKKKLENCVGSSIYIALATVLIRTQLQPLLISSQIRILCNEILRLNSHKIEILEYIQSKMKEIAPNLNSLVGSAVAANIVSCAGNLRKLAEMPSCNIQVLGLNRNNMPGMSNVNRFQSYLSAAPFVIQAGEFHKKALRMISGKVALAARVDLFHEYSDGSKGKYFLEQIQESLEKSSESLGLVQKKPLPIPKEIAKPHRGGKRIRAAKKKYELTEIRKQMNRVEFGVNEQDEYRDTGYTFGMLGKNGKTKTKVVKNKHKLSSKSTTALNTGTTSCFAFTNQNEIKLENPQNISSSQSKYFESTKGFDTVISNKNI